MTTEGERQENHDAVSPLSQFCDIIANLSSASNKNPLTFCFEEQGLRLDLCARLRLGRTILLIGEGASNEASSKSNGKRVPMNERAKYFTHNPTVG